MRLNSLQSKLQHLTSEHFIKSYLSIEKDFKGRSREFLFLDLVQDYSENRAGREYSSDVTNKFKKIKKSILSKDFLEAINRCDLDGKANYKLPNEITDIKFGNLKGKTITLSELVKRKKYLYLDFWASWCKPCIKEFKNIKETIVFLKLKNIDYILIDAHEGVFDKWIKDNQKLKLTNYESLFAQDLTSFTKLSQIFNIDVIPRFILINSDGEVVAFNAPRPSDPKFQKRINALINKK